MAASDQDMRRVAELHISQARSLAFSLLALADIQVPDAWKRPYGEQVLMEVYQFAVHARHLNEITDIDARSIDGVDQCGKKVVNPETWRLESSYTFALNRILHARSMALSWALWEGEKRWLLAKEEYVLSCLKITTDQRSAAHVSIFGLAYVFLTEVVKRLKDRHPDYQF